MELTTTIVPGQSHQFFDNLCPYPSSAPDSAEIRGHAANIQRLLQGTHDDIHPVFAQWTLLEQSYDTADTPTALMALQDYSIKLGALRTAGNLIAIAMHNWADFIDGYSPERIDYLTEAQSVVDLKNRITGLTESEVQAENDKNADGQQNLMSQYQGALNAAVTRGEQLQRDFSTHQQGLVQALKAIDLEVLSEAPFTSRDEGLTAVDSTEELQYILSNSAAFGDQLSYADIIRLSEQVDYENLPYDFKDEQGNKWVMTEDGTLVISGSPMDPYLEGAIMQAMAEDPELSSIEPVLGEDAEGNPLTSTLEDLGFGVAGAQADLVDGSPGGGAYGGVLTLVAVASLIPRIEDNALNASNIERSKYLLMSDEDINDVGTHFINRETVKAGAQTVATIPTAAAATATAVPSYGTSYVVAYLIDEATGEFIGAVVDDIYDDTWTEEEMYRKIEGAAGDKMTPEQYAEAMREIENVVEPASGPPQPIPTIPVDQAPPENRDPEPGTITVTAPAGDGDQT